jgi:hypothetical protein
LGTASVVFGKRSAVEIVTKTLATPDVAPREVLAT